MAIRSRFTVGQRVWAAIAFSPRYIIGVPVIYRSTSDGRFLRVEDDDGHRHSVARFYVFPTRAALVKKHPGLEVRPEPLVPAE